MSWPRRPVYCVITLALALGCVPRESGNDSTRDTEGVTGEAAPIPRWRPRPRVHSRASADASIFSAEAALSTAPNPLLTEIYKDDFDREQLGPNWTKTSERWSLRDGQICGQSLRNHPLWLNLRLPTNARIEFTATSFNNDGDIKVEAWGNGKSFAHGTTYDDATSYLFILGGWKNTLHVLARLNEHGDDRQELLLDKTLGDPRYTPLEPRKPYTVVIERSNGHTVTLQLNGSPLLSFVDPDPLTGATHDHFGFNGWETSVCFDDLLITPLAE